MTWEHVQFPWCFFTPPQNQSGDVSQVQVTSLADSLTQFKISFEFPELQGEKYSKCEWNDNYSEYIPD